MRKIHDDLKKFRIYYFIGDYWSGKGEQRKSTIVLARTESEAEKIFKKEIAPKNANFGWIQEL